MSNKPGKTVKPVEEKTDGGISTKTMKLKVHLRICPILLVYAEKIGKNRRKSNIMSHKFS